MFLLTIISLLCLTFSWTLWQRDRKIYSKFQNAEAQYQSLCFLLAQTFTGVFVWEDVKKEPFFYGRIQNFFCCKRTEAPQECPPHPSKAWSFFIDQLTKESRAQLTKDLEQLFSQGKSFDIFLCLEHEKLFAQGRIVCGNAMLKIESAQQDEGDGKKKSLAPIVVAGAHPLYEALEMAPDFFFSLDQKGKLLWGNKIFRERAKTLPAGQSLALLLKPKNNIVKPEGEERVINLHGERRFFLLKTWQSIEGKEQKERNLHYFAQDITWQKNLQQQLHSQQKIYNETLDLFASAVTIFNEKRELTFYNQAFISLWGVERSFLDKKPSHNLLLEKLREKGPLAQQGHWHQFKENLFMAYSALETAQYTWHLPDGRVISVLAHPHPQGGVTFLYDNLTEKLALEARYNTLIKIQGETLDNLAEAAVVFGADGLLRLANSAFGKLWHIPYTAFVQGTHIQTLQKKCAEKSCAPELWHQIANYITDFVEERECITGDMPLKDGRIFHYVVAPLPDLQMLLTFMDVTANRHYALALQHRNSALEEADKLRRTFVQQVSYQLRVPLTNIIGFTQLLLLEKLGQLNKAQKQNLEDIAAQSQELASLVDDILTLMTIEAGILELNLQEISAQEITDFTTKQLQEEIKKQGCKIEIIVEPPLRSIRADKARWQEILQLIAESMLQTMAPKTSLLLSVSCDNEGVVFSFEDRQRIFNEQWPKTLLSPTSIEEVFASPSDMAGLRLSLVKAFVHLHGGTIVTAPLTSLEKKGEVKGVRLSCLFPLADGKA